MTDATVFTNNRSQAVRLPAELRFPEHVKRVSVRAVGLERVIAPVDSTWDSFFLAESRPSEDFMAERAAQDQPERDPL